MASESAIISSMDEFYRAENTMQGTSAFLTIILFKENCQLETGQNKKIQGYMSDVVLLRKNISFLADKPVLVFYFDEKLFDSLFYSQIADCRILYDFLQDTSENNEYLYFSLQGNSSIEKIMDVLKEESEYGDIYHNKMVRLLLVGLFTLLDRSHDDTLVVAKSTMVSDNRFGRIMKYLGENFKTATLQGTAEKFGYNPDYLSTRFKLITGETFRRKLLNIRLEKAADLLLSTEMTVEEISGAVGFHDKSWFMKKFKEKYGLTPNRYRKSHS